MNHSYLATRPDQKLIRTSAIKKTTININSAFKLHRGSLILMPRYLFSVLSSDGSFLELHFGGQRAAVLSYSLGIPRSLNTFILSCGMVVWWYGGCRTWKMSYLTKKLLDRSGWLMETVVWCDDHILHTFLPSPTTNNWSERELYNIVCMSYRRQGRSVQSKFTLCKFELCYYRNWPDIFIWSRIYTEPAKVGIQ